MLEHGGKLRRAAARYRIPLAQWVDLSTGINPDPWPVPQLPQSCWLRLPEPEDGLVQAACGYYGAPQALPVAGSQAAIQALPLLWPACRVGVLAPGYAEHGHAWQRAGHQVARLAHDQVDAAADALDVLVITNPNNPTGHRFAPEQLLNWHRRLGGRGGWLVVDEAFMDVTPGDSLAPFTHEPGLMVLRSLGKFFGLAGARVGFVLAEAELLERLSELLGPWTVSGPAREVARMALGDRAWHGAARERLTRASVRLANLLTAHGLAPHGSTAYFQWVTTPGAQRLQDQFARQAILVRRFDKPSSLRFGLPGCDAHWRRLERALAALPGEAPLAAAPGAAR